MNKIIDLLIDMNSVIILKKDVHLLHDTSYISEAVLRKIFIMYNHYEKTSFGKTNI